MDLKQVLKHQYKKIILIALLVIVGFTMFRAYSGFFEKVNTMWETNLNYNVANLISLSQQKLDKAQFDVDYYCTNFDFSLEEKQKEEPVECKLAKERYAQALKEYQELQAKKDDLLNTQKQVKSYYDALILSAQQTPLPFGLLIITAIAFLGLVGALINEFLPKRKKN